MSRPRSIRQAAKAKRETDIWEAAPQWWRDDELSDDDMDALADQYQREQIASANSGTDEINYRRER